MKGACAALLAVGLAVAVIGTAILVSAASTFGAGGAASGASAAATAKIPPAMLTLYQQAAVTCPGLPWTILAAIGTVESDNGQSNRPGVHSGANSAGAEGPMQFEPKTFAAYDEPVPPGGAVPPSPYDPTDAVFAAARLLCADGASGGADISGAVYAYNHSASYVPGTRVGPVLPLRHPRRRRTRLPHPTRAQVLSPFLGPCRKSARPMSGVVKHPASASIAPDWCRPLTLSRAWNSPRRPGPVRRHAEAGSGRAPGARRPGLLRRRSGFHRPRGALCRHSRRRGCHGRRAPHGGRCPGRVLSRRHRARRSATCSSSERRGRGDGRRHLTHVAGRGARPGTHDDPNQGRFVCLEHLVIGVRRRRRGGVHFSPHRRVTRPR